MFHVCLWLFMWTKKTSYKMTHNVMSRASLRPHKDHRICVAYTKNKGVSDLWLCILDLHQYAAQLGFFTIQIGQANRLNQVL